MEKEELEGIRNEVLESLGVDGADIKDMRELRKDLEWARSNRRRCESIGGKFLTYFFLAAAGLTLALIWDGLMVKLGINK